MNKMIRIRSFTLDEIFVLYSGIEIQRKHRVVYKDCSIKLSSDRLQLFRLKGVCCIKCGIVGNVFWYEHCGNNQAHLNLYAEYDGVSRLMTKDHILAKSRGGKDHIDNYQVMCMPCNFDKGVSDG